MENSYTLNPNTYTMLSSQIAILNILVVTHEQPQRFLRSFPHQNALTTENFTYYFKGFHRIMEVYS